LRNRARLKDDRLIAIEHGDLARLGKARKAGLTHQRQQGWQGQRARHAPSGTAMQARKGFVGGDQPVCAIAKAANGRADLIARRHACSPATCAACWPSICAASCGVMASSAPGTRASGCSA
jgi:hypothetical protein